MEMKNGKRFSTGNHPVEALVPCCIYETLGFDFEIATPNGKPVVFEMWAMPDKDAAVMSIYEELKSDFENPQPEKIRLKTLKQKQQKPWQYLYQVGTVRCWVSPKMLTWVRFALVS